MNRDDALERISETIRGRQLIWFGTRGDDAAALEDLDQFSAAFSVIGRYDRKPGIQGFAFEDITGIRVDLDAHDIDEERPHGPVDELRGRLLDALNEPSVVVTYRPSTLLNGVTFARQASTWHLGMFKEHQFAFEHKPWVESAVARLGVPHVEWRYFANADKWLVAPLLRSGPVVLRASRGSGGTGIALITSEEDLRRAWPDEPGAFVGVASFIRESLPVNVSAVVWDSGITTHWPSVQIIGIPELTERTFGFCGSDFSAGANLAPSVVESLERSVTRVGEWMFRRGYRGAFGVDFLIVGGEALFMEVNPRFQGSSHLSSRISKAVGQSCVVLDHMAAHLGLQPAPEAPLHARVKEGVEGSYIVHHWPLDDGRGLGGAELLSPLLGTPGFEYADVVLPESRIRDKGAATYRAVFTGSVAPTGFAVTDAVKAALAQSDQRLRSNT